MTQPITDEDREALLDRLRTDLADIVAQNQTLLNEINVADPSITANPVSMMMFRLDALAIRVDTILKSILSEESQLQFELNYENRMHQELKGLRTQVTKSKLTQGVAPNEGSGVLYVPGG